MLGVVLVYIDYVFVLLYIDKTKRL